MNSRAEIFFEKVKLENSNVLYPQDIVFLCGGSYAKKGSYLSFRDFIYRNKADVLVGRKVILAEDAAKKFDAKIYDDLLQFEAHIASISRLVLLVSEGPGAIAELGAFSQISEIQPKLLVYLNSDHYRENSFIKDGPIRYLERHNEQSVWEFDWDINDDGSVEFQHESELQNAIRQSIVLFKTYQPRTEKFDAKRVGHLILLTAGIVSALSCCKIREIMTAFEILSIPIREKEVRKYIFCLELFGWVRSVKRDTRYYVSLTESVPFIFKPTGPFFELDNIRARHDIVHAYDENDPRLSVLDTIRSG
ncbi:MAG: retron St85 family effector protein [Parasphingorhabdus sp.]|uniref:retron St85 family effector protein n=1 Tax=Parasphingorhabdus sp. TaxID=2709688 RepID=UPI00329829BD